MSWKLLVHNRYWTIPNEILNNPDISFKAKWLWVFIQSKPDWWNFSIERISLQTKDWINSVSNWIKELENQWLLERKKFQNSKWYWEIEYNLYISKNNKNPTLENRRQENPMKENYINNSKKDLSKKDIVKNKHIYKIDFEIIKEEYKFLNHKDVEELFLEFLEIRKQKKAINSERAIKLLLKKLEWKSKLEIKKMIENAILNWWKSFYPLKKEFIDYKEQNKKQNKFVAKQVKENERYKNSWASNLWKQLAWQKNVNTWYIDYNKHNDDYYKWLEVLEEQPPF